MANENLAYFPRLTYVDFEACIGRELGNQDIVLLVYKLNVSAWVTGEWRIALRVMMIRRHEIE